MRRLWARNRTVTLAWSLIFSGLVIIAITLAGPALQNHFALKAAGGSPEGPLPKAAFTWHLHRRFHPDYHLVWVKLPKEAPFTVLPAIAQPGTLLGVEDWPNQGSLAEIIINAGYFDPNNKKTVSWVTLPDGRTLNPKENERLTENSNLAPWLPAIWERSEFRTLSCDTNKIRYEIAPHSQALPERCHQLGAVGGGPRLLPESTAEQEAFWVPAKQRDAVGYNRPDARMAIGFTEGGDLMLVMVQQPRSLKGKGGLSLPAFQAVLKELGLVEALNLDGGGSTSLWAKDIGTLYGATLPDGQAEKRKVLSVLQVWPAPTHTDKQLLPVQPGKALLKAPQ